MKIEIKLYSLKKSIHCGLLLFCLFSFFNASFLFADETRTIRTIKIIIRDVFDDNEQGLLYRAANNLKINTKEDIVKRELLFKEGDNYDSFVIQESGRNLRSLPFLREIDILEVVDGTFVDIVVSVQDTWTLFPIVALSSVGGVDKREIGLVEGNFLGYGKRVEGLIAEDEGRRKYEGVFDDRRFLGSLQRFTVGHFERSDGRESVVSWGRPFRSLVDESGWFTNAHSSDLIGRMFEAGDERFIYRHQRVAAMGGYTISSGSPSELLSRYTFGYSFSKDQFSEAEMSDFGSIGLDQSDLNERGGRLAHDRRFSGPVFSYQRIQPDFISLNYVDFFDRVEDFNLGNEFITNLHFSPRVLGSLDDALILRASNTRGKRLGASQFIRGQISGSARVLSDSVRQMVLTAQGRYYNVLGPKYWGKLFLGQHTLAAGTLLESGYSLDNDTEFLLGAGAGLRGYEDRAFSGSHRFSLNLEDRFHLIDEVAKLVSVGGAVFTDIGSVGRDNLSDLVRNGFYANIGVGLRLGLVRSSGGTVVRIDLAFPLRDGPDGSMQFEPRLLITTGQLFGASLRSDSLGLQTPAISAGFQ
jgi:outer membrane protein assembly factor BamA